MSRMQLQRKPGFSPTGSRARSGSPAAGLLLIATWAAAGPAITSSSFGTVGSSAIAWTRSSRATTANTRW